MEDFDYNSALQYFSAHSQNEALKRIFSRGESSYTRIRLKEELEKLKIVPKQPAEEKPETSRTIDYYSLPDDVKELIIKRNALRKKRNFNFVLMQKASNDQERAEHLGIVLSSDQELTGIQSEIDTFYKTGSLPTKKAEKVALTGIEELLRRKMTLRVYISRAKTASNKQKWESELKDVEDKLNYAVQN